MTASQTDSGRRPRARGQIEILVWLQAALNRRTKAKGKKETALTFLLPRLYDHGILCLCAPRHCLGFKPTGKKNESEVFPLEKSESTTLAWLRGDFLSDISTVLFVVVFREREREREKKKQLAVRKKEKVSRRWSPESVHTKWIKTKSDGEL
jgi:hypothetical protein